MERSRIGGFDTRSTGLVSPSSKRLENLLRNLKGSASSVTFAFYVNSSEQAAQRLDQYLVKKEITYISLEQALDRHTSDVRQDPNQLLNRTVVQLLAVTYHLLLKTDRKAFNP